MRTVSVEGHAITAVEASRTEIMISNLATIVNSQLCTWKSVRWMRGLATDATGHWNTFTQYVSQLGCKSIFEIQYIDLISDKSTR